MKKYLTVLLFIIVFSGCARVTEVDSKAFVTAIGFDKGENYDLRLTFVFTSPSKSGSNQESNEKDETIVVEAPSLYSAIEQINNFESKSIELTHTQTIIFSEELAREGLKEYIYMLVRSSHFRPNTYVCIADKSSMEFLEQIKPVQTYHLEKYFELLFNKLASGTKGDMYLYDLYFSMHSEGKAGILPYCAVNKLKLKEISNNKSHKTMPGKESENPTDEPTEAETIGGKFSENTDDYAINTIAGDNITKSENKAEIQGLAVLKEGVLTTILGREETLNFQMITNTFPDTYITLSNPLKPDKMITCLVSQKDKTKITVKCNEKIKVSIRINLEGDFAAVGVDDTFIKHPKAFEEYFEYKTQETIEKFLYKITRELNADICQFSQRGKASFSTIQNWKNYNWAGKFRDCEYDVDVNLTVRTYGELSQMG